MRKQFYSLGHNTKRVSWPNTRKKCKLQKEFIWEGKIELQMYRDEHKNFATMRRSQYLCDKVKEPWDVQ